MYARQTFLGSLVFQRCCATLTFCRAVSAVKGGLIPDMSLRLDLRLWGDGRWRQEGLKMCVPWQWELLYTMRQESVTAGGLAVGGHSQETK